MQHAEAQQGFGCTWANASILVAAARDVQYSVVPHTETEKAKIEGSVSVNTTHVAGIDLRRLLLQATTNLNSEPL